LKILKKKKGSDPRSTRFEEGRKEKGKERRPVTHSSFSRKRENTFLSLFADEERREGQFNKGPSLPFEKRGKKSEGGKKSPIF